MTDPILTLGSLPLTGFGLCCAAAVLLWLAFVYLYLRAQGVRYGQFIVYGALALPLGWVCSRLIFVLANVRFYSLTLGSFAPALYFWDGGYSLMGMLLGALLAAPIAARIARVPAARLLDAAALAAPMGILLERLAERGTGLGEVREILAETISFPIWAMEAIAAVVLMAALTVWLIRMGGKNAPAGDVLCVFMVLFGAAQVVLESLRGDGHMEVHFVRIQQVIALALVLSSLIVWTIRLIRSGDKRTAIVVWLVALVCIGAGVAAEFAVDRSDNKALAYTVMIACMLILAASALMLRVKAARAIKN